MLQSHNILIKILDVVDYKDDKEKFVNEFIKNIHIQSISDLISSLPTNKQEEIRTRLSADANPEKIAAILRDYFPQSQIQEVLTSAAKNSISRYLEAIKDTISDSQKERLITVLQEI